MLMMAPLQSCQRFLIRRGFSPVQRLLLLLGGIVGVVVLAHWFLVRGFSFRQGYSDGGDTLSVLSPDQWKRQAQLDYLASYMHVSYETVSNLLEDGHSARITLHNSGKETITRWSWSMYFYYRRTIEANQVKEKTTVELANLQIALEHINGDLYRMSPTKKFQDILPGKGLEIMFLAQAWVVCRCDISPNWFVASPGLQAKVLRSTAGESLDFVKAFDTEAKWKRRPTDLSSPFTPDSRYQRYDVQDLGAAPTLIVPTPFHVSYERSKSVVINDKWAIVVREGAEKEAKYLSDKLGLPVLDSIPQDHYILLNLGGVTLTPDQLKNEEEAYTLNSFGGDKEQILIGAKTARGIFYGIQTLLNMMDLDTGAVLHANIQDVPRYLYRGLMVDVARNFQPKAELMKLMDAMAAYKLNKLHLHLTDDEGWRLQIPGLEELTEVGIRKSFDPTEDSSLLPCLGSGPTRSIRGAGFYSVHDYQEILAYAADHHITVIPEFDMPGHGRAAIRSMEVRAQRLARKDKGKAAGEFLVSDPQDASQYLSVQKYKNNAFSPCLESTYQFVEHVIEQVIKMHKHIQDLETFHFGGDEVPPKAFSNSPACDNLAVNNPKHSSPTALKAYFVERISGLVAKHGLKLQGWEDGFYTENAINERLLSQNNVANAWYNVWEKGKGHRSYELANAGFQVVLSHATHLYFDHPQEPDPEEHGLYWATRYTDTKHTFGYTPLHIYNNIEMERLGKPLTEEILCEHHPCTPLEKPENIIGMEAALWSETVRNAQLLQHMVFPRLLALAERAWHQSPWEEEKDVRVRDRLTHEDWVQFANTLGYRELRRLEKLGMDYRLPVPGAIKEDGRLMVNSEFPGVAIQYSSDQGKTWRDWKTDGENTLSGQILLATRSFDGKRRSRSIEVTV